MNELGSTNVGEITDKDIFLTEEEVAAEEAAWKKIDDAWEKGDKEAVVKAVIDNLFEDGTAGFTQEEEPSTSQSILKLKLARFIHNLRNRNK